MNNNWFWFDIIRSRHCSTLVTERTNEDRAPMLSRLTGLGVWVLGFDAGVSFRSDWLIDADADALMMERLYRGGR